MTDGSNSKEYGKFLKHLRIDKDELLKDMAKKLELNTSYLSAIESGNRDIPPDLTEKICDLYELSEEDCRTLHEAELNTDRKVVQINMEALKESRLAKEVALSFAGKVATLSDEQLQKIKAVLQGQ